MRHVPGLAGMDRATESVNSESKIARISLFIVRKGNCGIEGYAVYAAKIQFLGDYAKKRNEKRAKAMEKKT